MKIAHVLPPLTKGGAEKVAVDLANYAVRQGHDVTIVAAYPVSPALLLDTVDPQVRVCFVTQKQSRFAKYLALLRWLIINRKWLLSRDVVHCHLTFGAIAGTGTQLMRSWSRGNKPVIVETYHAVGMPTPRINRAFAALLASGRDGLALMAEDDYWRCFRERHPNLPVKVIPNGIAMPTERPTAEEIDDYRKGLGIPESPPIIATVGRLVAGRMPLRMIDIFAEVDRLGRSDVHFLMGGEGPLLDSARDYAAAHGLGDRVHFPGLVERPLLAFELSDVYVSINVGSITGIAGLEAAACGRPVIALQARADHEMTPDDWIWSNPDPVKVAVEAVRLLGDAEARERLSFRQAQRVRANHSDAAMATAYETFYAECVGSKLPE